MTFTSPSAGRPAPVTATRSSRLRPVVVSKQNRSAATNGIVVLEGVDGRSPEGRRFRDLLVAYAEEIGGVEAL
jgi:hypothetical protein